MKTYRFEAVIQKHDGMDAAYITFPYNVKDEFSTKGQVKVKAVFDGKVEYRGSLANMGLDEHCLGLPKKVRAQLGKNAEDLVEVVLHRDTEPRVVEVPEDLNAALRENKLEAAFRKLSYTKQRQCVESILDARREETRKKRISNAIYMLKRGN